jgi:8-oxo-dGTP pyrophosphatase MutT (NUDIX family)
VLDVDAIMNSHTVSSDLVRPEMGSGASLLVAEGGRFLLAARPPQPIGHRAVIALTGIGGWVESGESFAQAVQREAVEETGSQIQLIDLHQTLVIHSPDRRELLCFVHETGPAALVFRRHGTPAFEPWSDQYQAIVAVAVYAGMLKSRPRVVAESEHPFFVWLYPEQMIALSDADEPLAYLLADGAEILGSPDIDIDRSVVRLTDSIQSLISALGPGAFSFLGDIARLTQPARAE